MSGTTSIEWTDRTWNPVRGCSRVSEGCRNCYAERVAVRFSRQGQPYAGLAKQTNAGPRWTGEIALIEKDVDAPLRWRQPARIFVNSMSDLFHEKVPDAFIDRVFAVMALAPQHTFQILTKRPERMRDYVDGLGRSFLRLQMACPVGWSLQWRDPVLTGDRDIPLVAWPIPNVWLGVSVEDQPTADARIPLLLQTPAAIRFVSYEPALGPVDFRYWVGGAGRAVRETTGSPLTQSGAATPGDGFGQAAGNVAESQRDPSGGDASRARAFLNWVIAGGESGPHAQPAHPDWFRSVCDQCQAAGVPFFFKQWGEWAPFYDRDRDDPDWQRVPRERPGKVQRLNAGGGCGFHGERVVYLRRVGKKAAGRELDGRAWDEFPKTEARV